MPQRHHIRIDRHHYATKLKTLGAQRKARGEAIAAARHVDHPGYERVSGYYGRYSTAGSAGTGELKFFDLDVDDSTVAVGGTIAVNTINNIGQGVTESERIGRKCTIKSVSWRYRITLPTQVSGSATSDQVRVILYLDKQCNGAAAVATDILEVASLQSFNNLANKSRFRTLHDKIYNLVSPSGSGRGATDTLAFGEDMTSDALYKKVNIPIEFDSTTGAITEIRSNNIGILLLSSAGLCQFISKTRIRFSDN